MDYIEVPYHIRCDSRVNIDEFVGKVFSEIRTVADNHNDDIVQILLKATDGTEYVMDHQQDCCEYVYVEDVAGGELKDIVGDEILFAEEVTNSGVESEYGDSYTWTFYKLSTNRVSLTIRWYGSSNGYYSEAVDITRLESE
jgi:hypothetical protein